MPLVLIKTHCHDYITVHHCDLPISFASRLLHQPLPVLIYLKKTYPVINNSHDEKMHWVEEELCETDSSLHWKSSKSSSLAVAEPYNANMQLNCSSYIISNMSRLVAKLVSYCELSLAAAAGTHCFSEISAELKYRSGDICSYGGFMYAVGKTT